MEWGWTDFKNGKQKCWRARREERVGGERELMGLWGRQFTGETVSYINTDEAPRTKRGRVCVLLALETLPRPLTVSA